MRSRGLLASLAGALFLLPVAAGAAEDELVVAAELGHAALFGRGEPQQGLGGHVTAWLGLNDHLWALGSLGLAGFPALEARPLLQEGFVGVVAALDVLRAIPFAEAAMGVTGAGSLFRPSLRFGLGLDYLFARTVSLGAVVRYRPLFEERLGGGSLSAELRLGLRIEL
jgi:hypothetical protein